MGLLQTLLAKLIGSASSKGTSTAVAPGVRLTVTVTGPAAPNVTVSDEEVAERVRQHAFVLSSDPPVLKTADQWWTEESHKRRRRDGSDKAYAWLQPFVPIEVAKLEALQSAQVWGPRGAAALAKELRALIRQRRKTKEPYADLLRAMYGACIAADVSVSLSFEGVGWLAAYVDVNDVHAIRIDYGAMGYQCINSLGKTDVKWLVEAFGEPAEHQSFDSLWPSIRRDAVSRYCWSELRRSNDSKKYFGQPEQTMRAWLEELVKRNIGYHKEWQERVAARQAYLSELAVVLDAAWAATRVTFVVADIETTGLSAETDEVLELGALRVDAGGTVLAELSVLVKISGPVPPVITRLTGITQREVDLVGLPLSEAMRSFTQFVGSDPVFFHNAPFDRAFVTRDCGQAGQKFTSAVHDTLPLARQAWPSLDTYKLAALAEHVSAPFPKHRAVSDARAALAVLLAARAKVCPV